MPKRKRSASTSSEASTTSSSSSPRGKTCGFCDLPFERTLFQSPWCQCETCGRWYHHYCLGLPAASNCAGFEFRCEFCEENPEWGEVARWRNGVMHSLPNTWAKGHPPNWLPASSPSPTPPPAALVDLVTAEIQKGLKERTPTHTFEPDVLTPTTFGDSRCSVSEGPITAGEEDEVLVGTNRRSEADGENDEKDETQLDDGSNGHETIMWPVTEHPTGGDKGSDPEAPELPVLGLAVTDESIGTEDGSPNEQPSVGEGKDEQPIETEKGMRDEAQTFAEGVDARASDAESSGDSGSFREVQAGDALDSAVGELPTETDVQTFEQQSPEDEEAQAHSEAGSSLVAETGETPGGSGETETGRASVEMPVETEQQTPEEDAESFVEAEAGKAFQEVQAGGTSDEQTDVAEAKDARELPTEDVEAQARVASDDVARTSLVAETSETPGGTGETETEQTSAIETEQQTPEEEASSEHTTESFVEAEAEVQQAGGASDEQTGATEAKELPAEDVEAQVRVETSDDVARTSLLAAETSETPDGAGETETEQTSAVETEQETPEEEASAAESFVEAGGVLGGSGAFQEVQQAGGTSDEQTGATEAKELLAEDVEAQARVEASDDLAKTSLVAETSETPGGAGETETEQSSVESPVETVQQTPEEEASSEHTTAAESFMEAEAGEALEGSGAFQEVGQKGGTSEQNSATEAKDAGELPAEDVEVQAHNETSDGVAETRETGQLPTFEHIPEGVEAQDATVAEYLLDAEAGGGDVSYEGQGEDAGELSAETRTGRGDTQTYTQTPKDVEVQASDEQRTTVAESLLEAETGGGEVSHGPQAHAEASDGQPTVVAEPLLDGEASTHDEVQADDTPEGREDVETRTQTVDKESHIAIVVGGLPQVHEVNVDDAEGPREDSGEPSVMQPALLRRSKVDTWKADEEEYFGRRFPLVHRDDGKWEMTEMAKEMLGKVEGGVLGVVGVGEGRSGVSSFLNAFRCMVEGRVGDTMHGFEVSDPTVSAKKGTQGAWGTLIDAANVPIHLPDTSVILLVDVQRITISGNVADHSALLAAIVAISSKVVTLGWADDSLPSYLTHFTISSALAKSISGGSLTGTLSDPAITILTSPWPDLTIITQGTVQRYLNPTPLALYYPHISLHHLPHPSVMPDIVYDLSYSRLTELLPDYVTSLKDLVPAVLKTKSGPRVPSGAVLIEVLTKVLETAAETVHMYPRIPTLWQAWVINTLEDLRVKITQWGREVLLRCSTIVCDGVGRGVTGGVKSITWNVGSEPPTVAALKDVQEMVMVAARYMYNESVYKVFVTEEEQKRSRESWEQVEAAIKAYIVESDAARREKVVKLMKAESAAMKTALKANISVLDMLEPDTGVVQKSAGMAQNTVKSFKTKWEIHDEADLLHTLVKDVTDSTAEAAQQQVEANAVDRAGFLRNVTAVYVGLMNDKITIVAATSPTVLGDELSSAEEEVWGLWEDDVAAHMWSAQYRDEKARLGGLVGAIREAKTGENDRLIQTECGEYVGRVLERFKNEAEAGDLTMPKDVLAATFADRITVTAQAATNHLSAIYPTSPRVPEAVSYLTTALTTYTEDTLTPLASSRWAAVLTTVFSCVEKAPLNSTRWRAAVSRPHVKKVLRGQAENCFEIHAVDIPLSRSLADLKLYVDTAPLVTQHAWLDNGVSRNITSLAVFTMLFLLTISPLYWEEIKKHF